MSINGLELENAHRGLTLVGKLGRKMKELFNGERTADGITHKLMYINNKWSTLCTVY